MTVQLPWWAGLILAAAVVGLFVWLRLKHPEATEGKGWIAGALAALLSGISLGSWLSKGRDELKRPAPEGEHPTPDPVHPQPKPAEPNYEDDVDELPTPDPGHTDGLLGLDELDAIDGAADAQGD